MMLVQFLLLLFGCCLVAVWLLLWCVCVRAGEGGGREDGRACVRACVS